MSKLIILSGFWYRVFRYVVTKVSDKFYIEDGHSNFIRNAGQHVLE